MPISRVAGLRKTSDINWFKKLLKSTIITLEYWPQVTRFTPLDTQHNLNVLFMSI